jgi:hypothetical protein
VLHCAPFPLHGCCTSINERLTGHQGSKVRHLSMVLCPAKYGIMPLFPHMGVVPSINEMLTRHQRSKVRHLSKVLCPTEGWKVLKHSKPAHAIKALSRREHFSSILLHYIMDICSHNGNFFHLLFGNKLICRLGLFHFIQRFIWTLQDSHIDYWAAIVKLKTVFMSMTRQMKQIYCLP